MDDASNGIGARTAAAVALGFVVFGLVMWLIAGKLALVLALPATGFAVAVLQSHFPRFIRRAGYLLAATLAGVVLTFINDESSFLTYAGTALIRGAIILGALHMAYKVGKDEG